MMQNSNTPWVRLGDYITSYDQRNTTGFELAMLGINKDKVFMPTVANTTTVDKTKYKIISCGNFVFSGMQTGRDICIRLALYDGEEPALISPAYTTFSVVDKDTLLPDYLFMYFFRKEMDRYGWFISDSSVRSNLDWERFIEIMIPLPSIERQRELVNAWRGLKDMKEENEQIAEPLQSLCRSYLQELKHKYPMVEIGQFITLCDERNSDLRYGIEDVRGLATSKQIIPTKAIMNGVSVKSYKLLKPAEFAYVADTSRRADKMSLGYNNSDDTYIISSISTVFKVKDNSILSSDYVYLLFCKSEFDRYARFNSWGSAREVFSYDEMCRVKIPLPPIKIQEAVVELFRCADESRKIATEANTLSADICPALMQKVIRE